MSKSRHVHRTKAEKAKLDAELRFLMETTDFSMKEIAWATGITKYYAFVNASRMGYRRMWTSEAERDWIIALRRANAKESSVKSA